MVSEVGLNSRTVMATQLKPPAGLNLEGNVSRNWREFKRGWELFAIAAGITEKPAEVHVATFLHVAGQSAQGVHDTFTYGDGEDKNNIRTVIAKFQAYCEPKKNITVARYKFNSRCQKAEETFIDYLAAVNTLVNDCEVGSLRDELVRDRIVCGILNEKVRETLLRVDELTLQAAVDTCIAAEISAEQLRAITLCNAQPEPATSDVHEVKKQCQRCTYYHVAGRCPAIGKSCLRCQKKDHFARACKAQLKYEQRNEASSEDYRQSADGSKPTRELEKRGQRTVKLVEIEEDDEISLSKTPYTIDSIEANIDSISPEWTHNCVVNGEIVQFKLDTGSQVDIIPESVCKKLNHKVEESPVKLRSYSDHTITPIGQTNVEINTGKCRITATFQVVRGQKAPLLGKDTCEKTGLLKRVYNVSSDASSTVKSAKAQMDTN